MMKTVDKALSLLDYFTVEAPEHGLSDMARSAGLEKATTLRLLNSLAAHGIVEQHPVSKKYRLGKSLLRLARVREASFPVLSIIQPVLERLAAATGETAHASLANGPALISVGIAEPQRSTRAVVDPSEVLPYHATASGLVFLAYAEPEDIERIVARDEFSRHTDHTITSADALLREVETTRARGYAISERSFESEITGIAAPIFDWSGKPHGAISVASVASRLDDKARHLIAGEVIKAAIEVTRAMGAEPHPDLIKAGKEFPA